MKTHRIAAGCIIILMIFSSAAVAGDLPKYFLSIRLVGNVGSNTQEHKGLLFDTRYFLTERFDLGFSYQLTDPQKVEMPAEIEEISSSGELNGEAIRQIGSFYSLFHPFGRDHTIDYYFGASINVQVYNIEDIIGDDYKIVADTPPALGFTGKTGANWFFHKNIGLTVDAEAGAVFHDYSAEDINSGTSGNFDSPEFVYLLSMGISFRF